MGETLDIRPYSGADKAAWDHFTDGSKNGTFHLKRDFVEYHQHRFTDYSLMVFDNKVLKAIVPANIRDNCVYSHEGLTYGGILVEKDIYLTEYIALVRQLLEYLKRQGISKFIIKELPWTYASVFNDDFRYLMQLADAAITRFDILPHIDLAHPLEYQQRRTRSIKKATASGYTISESTDLPAFWQLLESVLEKYGARPVHSIEEITTLQQHFPDHIRLFGIREGAEYIAGVLVFETERVARMQYIAASEKGKQTGALDLLFHELISGIYKDKKYLEFGTTTLNRGLKLNFGLSDQKEGFGARSVVHQTYEINIGTLDLSKIEQLKL
jgi:hypothetical protein